MVSLVLTLVEGGSAAGIWKLLCLGSLPYYLVGTLIAGAALSDSTRAHPQPIVEGSWSLAHIYPEPQDKDYAIVTRVFDPVTHQPFLSLAGLHSFGCQIAAEFVSQESFWNGLGAHSPAGWEKMNLQVVLETNIIGTTSSPPKIADAFFWK